MKKKNETFLTVKDASKMLNLSQSVIYTVLQYEKLDSERIGGRIVINKDELKKWSERNVKLSIDGGGE
jgi:excisionase family DNA binding protein